MKIANRAAVVQYQPRNSNPPDICEIRTKGRCKTRWQVRNVCERFRFVGSIIHYFKGYQNSKSSIPNTPDSLAKYTSGFVDSFLLLEYPHSSSPAISLWVNRNLIGKWIGFACRNRGYVVFFSVDGGHNFHRRLQQHSLHSFPNLCSF